MRRFWAWLLLFGTLATADAQTFRIATSAGPIALQTKRSFHSPNGKYRLTVEESDNSVRSPSEGLQLSATMTLASGAGTNLWRANFRGNNVAFLQDSEVIVSNDGEFFVIRPRGGNWALFKKWRDQIALPMPASASYSNESILEIDRLGEEPIVRIWNHEADEWLAYSILKERTFKPTPEQAAQWNNTTRAHVLDKLARARNESLRRKINSLSPTLSRVTEKAMQPTTGDEPSMLHYEFLALRGNPEDRPWFQHLLEKKSDSAQSQFGIGSYAILGNGQRVYIRQGQFLSRSRAKAFEFICEDADREYGDWFLSLFDKKLDRKKTPLNQAVDRMPSTLGRANGAVLLPAPIAQKTGAMRIYLVPAEQAGKNWNAEETETISEPLGRTSVDQKEFTEEITFAFRTVLPGKYKLKAIWDKRPHYTDEHAAGPGDYESDWVGPLTIEAGKTLNNVHVFCTNRANARGGEMYYAADAMARAEKWKARGEIPFYAFQPTYGRTEIYSNRISGWAIRTNSHAARARDTLERITFTTAGFLNNPKSLPRPPKLCVIWRSDHFVDGQAAVPPTTVRIIDEHGCAFAPDDTRTIPHYAMAVFGAFPRSAPTFRLVGYGPNGKSETIFDYTLTNHVRAERQLMPEPQKLPITLTLGDLKATIRKVTAPNMNGWMDASFVQDGIETVTWWASEVIFADADGNILDPSQMCREEKVTRVLGRFSRTSADPLNESRPFEFEIPRFKPYAGDP